MTVEPIEIKRKRLIFRSGHRGTKEMDLFLGSFAAKNVPGFSPEELALYDDLLNEPDPDLYNWITGKVSVPAHKTNSVVALLLSHEFAA
ncbi:MAG: succinate dehydrogenase assembly factor 2 [Alphaproteobacteria bacterium]|nr:succinate dehydrogenase assembly factor 2 [Alphaproteobacteria bacterium]